MFDDDAEMGKLITRQTIKDNRLKGKRRVLLVSRYTDLNMLLQKKHADWAVQVVKPVEEGTDG